jgi:hypothetical protein
MDALFRGFGVFGRPRIGLIFTSQFGPWPGELKATVRAPCPPHLGWKRHFHFHMDAKSIVSQEAKRDGGPHKLSWKGCPLGPETTLEYRVNIRGTSLRRSWSTRWQGGCATADSISERIRRGGRYLGSYGTHPGATPTSQIGETTLLDESRFPTAAGSGLFTLSGRSRETRRQLLPSPARSRPQAPLLIRMPI